MHQKRGGGYFTLFIFQNTNGGGGAWKIREKNLQKNGFEKKTGKNGVKSLTKKGKTFF